MSRTDIRDDGRFHALVLFEFLARDSGYSEPSVAAIKSGVRWKISLRVD
jgi:hypothetical protein